MGKKNLHEVLLRQRNYMNTERGVNMDIPQIKVISTKKAVEILEEHGMTTNANKIGLGLQQGVYPCGVAIKSHQWIYEIYENLLMKWIEERSS